MANAAPPDRGRAEPGAVVPFGNPARLPVPVTSIIGRESEVAAVCDLLRRDGVRLVTLTGPGGVGKTRLALHVAAELEPDFADGVSFVRLAAVADPALVAPTVARGFGVQEGGDRSVAERLAEVVGGRRILLVLDNFEHLLPAGTFAAGLLAACPGLRLLVTSRAVLRLSGEHGYPVPPLEVPAANASPARAAEAGAVRLFAERAHAADPSFALTAENASAVVAICARLEGLPLAVELAAVKIRLLPPRALLDRLADRLPLLTGGPRDLPARQRTMRDTIAWSYDLLSPAEQALFRRLAVFAGGFTLTAAAAVMAGTGHGDGDVFDGVEVLVEQSLVRRVAEVAGEPRFRMFETVREYGIERLTTGGETAPARDAHAAYCVTLAEPADPHLLMPGQERWLDLFDAEHANLRAALTWLEQSRQPDQLLRLVAALRWFWYVRGHLSEGRGWMERSLALGDPSPSNERARVLIGLGTLTLYQGDYERAPAAFAESLKLCAHLGDRREAAVALLALGLTTYANGDYALAATQTEASLALFREFADPVFASNALENLGEIAHAQGDISRAIARYEEALALQRATGFTWGAIQSLWGLGNVARAEGDLERAMVFYQESLALAAHHGDQRWVAYVLAGVAGVAIAQDRAEQAAQLFGAVDALLNMIGAAVLPVDQAAYAHGVAAARAKLGDDGFTSAWQAGRAMPLEQAVVEAGIVASVHSTTNAPPMVAALSGLTAREAQILRQVAAGRSTPEIADALFISARTVSSHLTNIFAKLDVRNRAEAVAYAVRHGLD